MDERRSAVAAATRLLRAELGYQEAQRARDPRRYAAALDELRAAEAEATAALRLYSSTSSGLRMAM